MTLTIYLFLTGAGLLLLLPVTVLFIEVLFAVIGPRGAADREGRPGRGRLAVVMPAHNEALGILETLRSLLPELDASDRLIVVADNCSDDTAAISTKAGAETIERTDLTRRGKGYALDFGVRYLESDPPDVVILVDADCQVEPGSIERLARECRRSGRPIQALYLMRAPKGAGLKMRIAEFAWVVKNQVRPLGLQRLGLPCQLMGTGMAFPWKCIQSAPLATADLVEDLKLGLDLAQRGNPPQFCAQAIVTSQFPKSTAGLRSQRMRWEHGHLSVIISHGPHLIWKSISRLNLDLMALALDFCIPPLALLALQVVAIWVASVVFWLLTKSYLPLTAATVSIAVVGLSILLAWGFFGRRIVSLLEIALALFYPLIKIPLYIRFLTTRQLEWVRSKRDREDS